MQIALGIVEHREKHDLVQQIYIKNLVYLAYFTQDKKERPIAGKIPTEKIYR